MDEPLDLERARLLLVWLQARRALDHCLSELLAAGPAGERRVRGRLDLVTELEQKAENAFESYRESVSRSTSSGAGDSPPAPTVLHRVRAGHTRPS